MPGSGSFFDDPGGESRGGGSRRLRGWRLRLGVSGIGIFVFEQEKVATLHRAKARRFFI